MKHGVFALALFGSLFLFSCDRGGDEGDNPWPVWILYVTVVNGTNQQPIQSCAEVVWTTSESNEIQRTTCQNTDDDRRNFVKVWRSIENDITIFYHVEAEGYQASGDQSVYFDRDLAYTRPGAPGDEVIESAQVTLFPN
jgi:hypothetical protein